MFLQCIKTILKTSFMVWIMEPLFFFFDWVCGFHKLYWFSVVLCLTYFTSLVCESNMASAMTHRFLPANVLRWCWISNLDVHWYNNVWVRRWVVVFYYFHQNHAKSRSLWMPCFLFSLCIYSTSEWVGWVMCKEGAGGGALLSLH